MRSQWGHSILNRQAGKRGPTQSFPKHLQTSKTRATYTVFWYGKKTTLSKFFFFFPKFIMASRESA